MDQNENIIWPSVESNSSALPIVAFTFVTDSDVTYTVVARDRATLKGDLGAAESESSWIGKIMGLAYSIFWSAYDFVGELIYWIRYFFVDNLAMVVALFLAVPMAFAAKNGRGNPEKFLRQYFKTLKGFFEFILSLWRMLLESIGTIRGWFRI